MLTKEQEYASKIFLNAAVPLAKVIATDRPKLNKPFKGKHIIVQIMAKDDSGDIGTYFDINDGEWTVVKGIAEKYDIALIFKDVQFFIDFFAGRTKKLPKLVGISKFKCFLGIMIILLKMASLLQAKDYPKKEEDRELLVKLYFYLLSNGISQLNKAGHPAIHEWASKSPDRVFAFEVIGKPELSAYIRVKAGKSKASRGVYTRSKPFFTLGFDSVESALGILMEKADMLDYTAKGKLIMGGAPEFGAQIGAYMLIIAGFAK